MWGRAVDRRGWLLSKALETCSSLGEALQLAKEAEAFLALSDDTELPVLPGTALHPSPIEIVKAKIATVADPEAQSTGVVAAAEVETPVTILPEPGSDSADSDSAPNNGVVSTLSVFATPEDVIRYLRQQGVSVEATETGRYKVAGRLESLSLLQTRANALRTRQNLPLYELMPIPAVRPKQASSRRAAQFR